MVLRAASGAPFGIVGPVLGHSLEPGEALRRSAAYVRLDARIERIVRSGAHRLTLFGEALNALNRDNASVDAIGLSPMASRGQGTAPRRFSVGAELALSH